MREQLQQIRTAALDEISQACGTDALEKTRVKYLGKKGELTAILRGMGALGADERPVIGQLANTVREDIESALDAAVTAEARAEAQKRLGSETIDVTLPGIRQRMGRRHPMTQVLDDIYGIFTGMGFSIAEGPEVEYTYYNFDALHTPDNHPSKELTDTFYVSDNIVLRTQTSPMQVRTMEKQQPPIRIISPGRTYRNDQFDATHSPAFFQIEGLVVDEGITMGDLKGTLAVFAKQLYGDYARVRFRPHYFPFTEPSAEMDVTCFKCHGVGCPLCKGEGFIEILGCGMVHPFVLQNSGIDPQKYSGFAFGMGLERLTMARYSIDDLRHFYEGDMRFLRQF